MITYRTFDEESMINNLNIGKDALLGLLFEQGLIKEDVCEDYLKNYHVTIMQPSSFARWWEKYFPKKEELCQLVIVKNMTISEPKTIKEANEK